MFILQLNDMRDPKIEMMTLVACATSSEQLLELMTSESVETYQDGQWGKTFRKDGPLEWYNRPTDPLMGIVDIGSVEDWQRAATEKYEELLAQCILRLD